MGFCILGGKENYLRKVISDKLTSLGQAINIGATATAFANAIQTIYDSRYTAGQDSLKTDRKLTLTSSQTGNNINIADNWYTTCDASAVYTAGQNSVKTSRKLTLTASQTGSNVDIADNWYTTCDASAVYKKGKTDGGISRATHLTTMDGSGNKTYTTTAAYKAIVCVASVMSDESSYGHSVSLGSMFTFQQETTADGQSRYAKFITGIAFNVAKGTSLTAWIGSNPGRWVLIGIS